MNVVVLVKSVPDTAAMPEIADGRTVFSDHLETVLNPYDEIAVEEGVRLKETLAARVTAVSFGGEEGRRALRTAFAMGADVGILVVPPPGETAATGRGIAVALAAILRELAPDLVLAGKQAVDDDGAQVAERVAEILHFQHASAVTRLVREGERLVVDREIEGGTLTVEMPLPAVVTVEKGLNTPRYPALPQLLKARRREIREVPAPASVPPAWQVTELARPRTERKRQILSGNIGEQVATVLQQVREFGGTA